MRQFIRNIGLTKAVIVFSFLGVCLAATSTLAGTSLLQGWGMDINLKAGLIISVVISLIITPLLSLYLVRLLMEVDRLEEEMRTLSTFDTLTGLLTKREFLDRANYFHKIAVREELTYALVLADLDNFNDINEEFGLMIGDKALASLGAEIQKELRESDLACRFGGEEFLFFLPNTSPKEANHFCDRMHSVIKNAVSFPGLRLPLRASMGIAAYPETPTDSIEDFISAADKKMYLAKENRGDQTG